MDTVSTRTASGHISRRQEFTTHGALCGRWTSSRSTGQLPADHVADYLSAFDPEEFDGELYVVYSYATPIAWWGTRGWTVPGVQYSVTTSKHQSQVRQGVRHAAVAS